MLDPLDIPLVVNTIRDAVNLANDLERVKARPGDCLFHLTSAINDLDILAEAAVKLKRIHREMYARKHGFPPSG